MRQAEGEKAWEKPFLTASTTHEMADGWDKGSPLQFLAPFSLNIHARDPVVFLSLWENLEVLKVFVDHSKPDFRQRPLKIWGLCWLQWVVSSYLLKNQMEPVMPQKSAGRDQFCFVIPWQSHKMSQITLCIFKEPNSLFPQVISSKSPLLPQKTTSRDLRKWQAWG